MSIEIVEYKGEKYKKIPDNGHTCNGCCFEDKKEKCCKAPNDKFYGCEIHKFHWEKENKK